MVITDVPTRLKDSQDEISKTIRKRDFFIYIGINIFSSDRLSNISSRVVHTEIIHIYVTAMYRYIKRFLYHCIQNISMFAQT